jgi:hypothetical protein
MPLIPTVDEDSILRASPDSNTFGPLETLQIVGPVMLA